MQCPVQIFRAVHSPATGQVLMYPEKSSPLIVKALQKSLESGCRALTLTGSAGKHQSQVSKQAPTALPSTVVKNGEDNPQIDVLGQLLLSNRFYHQL